MHDFPAPELVDSWAWDAAQELMDGNHNKALVAALLAIAEELHTINERAERSRDVKK